MATSRSSPADNVYVSSHTVQLQFALTCVSSLRSHKTASSALIWVAGTNIGSVSKLLKKASFPNDSAGLHSCWQMQSSCSRVIRAEDIGDGILASPHANLIWCVRKSIRVDGQDSCLVRFWFQASKAYLMTSAPILLSEACCKCLKDDCQTLLWILHAREYSGTSHQSMKEAGTSLAYHAELKRKSFHALLFWPPECSSPQRGVNAIDDTVGQSFSCDSFSLGWI